MALTGSRMFHLWNWWNSMLHLEFPNISHKSRYLDMMAAWKSTEETPVSPRRLFVWESYEEFLQIISEDMTANAWWVNSTLFFFMDDDEILWAIQIRHHIDHPRLAPDGDGWGHIGYWLCPSARGKWLAKEMLFLGLEEARKLWLEKVLISADEDNPASWKTIERCGGVFDRMVWRERDQKNLKLYWIGL